MNQKPAEQGLLELVRSAHLAARLQQQRTPLDELVRVEAKLRACLEILGALPASLAAPRPGLKETP